MIRFEELDYMRKNSWPEECIQKYANHPVMSKKDESYFDDDFWNVFYNTDKRNILCNIRYNLQTKEFNKSYFDEIMKTFDELLFEYKQYKINEKLKRIEKDF